MIGAGMTTESGNKSSATYPYGEMGQTWSTPVFGKVYYGGSAKDVFFIGAGYDNDNQDQGGTLDYKDEDEGRGVYVVDPLTAERLWRYTRNDNSYMCWSVPSDIAAIDTTGNGFTDRLYVGDMGARMWRFDISSSDTADWTDEARMLFDKDNFVFTGLKIFYPPDVTLEEDYELVYFATGDRAHPNSSGVVNRIYAVKDAGSSTVIREDDLVNVTDDCLQEGCGGAELRNQIVNGDGWYIRLEDNTGEKVLASPLLFGGVVYITSFAPLTTEDPCLFNEGVARLYALNYRTGEAALNYDTTTEALGRTDRSLVIGSAIPSRLVVSLIQGTLHGYIGIRGGILKPEINQSTPLTRIFWRELL